MNLNTYKGSILVALVCLLSMHAVAQVSVTDNQQIHQLMKRVLNDDAQAQYELAVLLSQPDHVFHSPEQSQRYLIKAARNGHEQAKPILVNQLADPLSPFYDPSRALFWARRTPSVNAGMMALYEFFALQRHAHQLPTNINMLPLDTQHLINTFRHYPFSDLSHEVRNHLAGLLNQPIVTPYSAFVSRFVYIPFAIKRSLYVRDVSAQLQVEGFVYEQQTGKWENTAIDPTISAVQVTQEADQLPTAIALYYPNKIRDLKRFEQLVTYYDSYLGPHRSRQRNQALYYRPGMRVTISYQGEMNQVLFEYADLPALRQSQQAAGQ